MATKRDIIKGLRLLADVMERDLRNTAMDEPWTGPDQTRENVVGTGTKSKNKNMGNSGFSGGQHAAA